MGQYYSKRGGTELTSSQMRLRNRNSTWGSREWNCRANPNRPIDPTGSTGRYPRLRRTIRPVRPRPRPTGMALRQRPIRWGLQPRRRGQRSSSTHPRSRLTRTTTWTDRTQVVHSTVQHFVIRNIPYQRNRRHSGQNRGATQYNAPANQRRISTRYLRTQSWNANRRRANRPRTRGPAHRSGPQQNGGHSRHRERPSNENRNRTRPQGL